MGNSADDLDVWRYASSAIIVNLERGVERRARQQANVAEVLETRRNQLRGWVKALRLHRWMKNLLIFVPQAFICFTI